jgi:hypothetical protein
MSIRKTIFGRLKNKPNTFIGGISSTINTPGLIASKLGISPGRIKAFRIMGPDIQFVVIGGSYVIPNSAFSGNMSLTYFNDQDGLVTAIGSHAFYQCGLLGSVLLNKVTSIGNGAFGLCSSVTSYNFPELVTIISSALTTQTPTFRGNTSLASFSAPKLASIAGGDTTQFGWCFSNCSNLTTFYAPLLGGALSRGTFASCSKLTSLTTGALTSIGNDGFSYCPLLSSIDLSYATSIGDNAFLGCLNLTEVNHMNNVLTIGNTAFQRCALLQTFSANKVTSIGNGAFGLCSSVTSYDFPELVTIISSALTTQTPTFRGNTSLTSFSAPKLTSITGGDTTQLGWCFSNCSNLTTFYAPLLGGALARGTFASCSKLTSLTTGALTSIGNDCFSSCALLSSIDLSYAVFVGDSAFAGCLNLIEVNHMNNVLTIGNSAFRECALLLTFSANKVTSIGNSAFGLCSSVTSYTFPELVTIISSARTTQTPTFRGNTSLTSFSAPKLTSITGGDTTQLGWCFSNCSNLTTFYAPLLGGQLDRGTFLSCSKLASFIVGAVTIIGDDCFSGCSLLGNVNIPTLLTCGSTAANNNVFLNIKTGATITVSSALQRNNNGAPDGDLVYASGTRGATIVYSHSVIAGAYGSISQKSFDNGVSFSDLGTIGGAARGIALSENTKYVTVADQGGITVSNDFGLNRTVVVSGIQFFGCAMSNSGQYQIVCPNNNFIYQSSDYGITFTTKHVSQNYRGAAMSADGKYQIACGYSSTNLVLSTDFGVTWNNITSAGLQSWNSAKISDSGQYITAVAYNNTIRVSNDFGETWINKTSYGNFADANVAMSSNGQYQTVTGEGKNIYTSSDFGATFTQNTTSGTFIFSGVSMNGEGNLQAACVSNGFIYISNDYGTTWVQSGILKNYQDIAVSR